MADCFLTPVSSIVLSSTAIYSSHRLFKDHRAPSLGLFLLGLSAAASVPSSSGCVRRDAVWAGEVLAPALVSFDLLWLSRDRGTARVLLGGSCLLLGLRDRLWPDTLTVLTRCLGLTSLSCCLTVCLFAGSAVGALGGVALSLPLLLAPLVSEGPMKWFLDGALSVGCWASTKALGSFLLDVTDRCHISIY